MPLSPRTLRPAGPGIHPEALAWRTRVIANGATVSGSTLSAVDRFCKSIVAAGIRDKFYRLNLFCGNGLNACLVPLYRGPSASGTQYGSATDTNTGPFVSGDYSETTGLLHSQGNAKWLDTGLDPGSMPQSVYEAMHLSAYTGNVASVVTDPYLLGSHNSTLVERMSLQTSIRTASPGFESGRVGRATSATAVTGVTGARGPTFLIVSRTSSTSLKLYRNGLLEATVSTSVTGITSNPYPIYIFRINNTGTASGDSNTIYIRTYSIGAGMTDAQAAAFHAAQTAFNTAMGRS